VKHRRTTLLVPIVALLAGVSRRAYLETPTGTRTWQYPASIHLLGLLTALLLSGILVLYRRLPAAGTTTHRRQTTEASEVAINDGRRARELLTLGTTGLLLPVLLTAWASTKLAHAFILLMLLVPLLLLRGRRDGTRAGIPSALVAAGVALLALGKASGLGLGPVPAAYFTLTVGGTRPGTDTLLAMVALGAGAALTTRFLRALSLTSTDRDRTRTTAMILAPVGTALPVLALIDGYPPVIDAWTITAGIAVAATLLCIARIARRLGPHGAAIALAAGALPASFATARFNDVPLTTPMRIGAFLMICGTVTAARAARRAAPGDANHAGDDTQTP